MKSARIILIGVIVGLLLGAILNALGVTAEIADDHLPKPLVIQAGRFAYQPSPVTGYASWSAERLDASTLDGRAVRDEKFRVDSNLPRELRASLADYVGGGKDIGHFAASNNYHHVDDQRATFVLSNAAPQDPSLNRGVWARIESDVLALVEADRVVWVVTGPIYRYPVGSKPQTQGRMIVPSDFAKCVLVETDGKPRWMYAWCAPNVDPKEKTKEDFRVTVRQVEELALIDVFSWLPRDVQNRLETER